MKQTKYPGLVNIITSANNLLIAGHTHFSFKKYLLSILPFLLFAPCVFPQGFAGINMGNYAGITGVMLQPASIVDSRFKFDINLFSTDARYSNNYLLLNRNVLLKFNKSNFDDYPTFRSKYLSEATLAPGEKTFFNISNRTQLPLSFMLTLNEKSAVAFNLQSRSLMQGRNISQDLAKLAFNNFYHLPFTNQALDASGVTLRSLSWVEAGLTYGRVLLSSGNHFLKGAVTGKYLGGVSSLNLSANNLTVQVNNDSSFNFTTDRVNYDHNKNADFNRVIDSRFRPDANAFGLDAGLVYEFRGHLNNIKYIRNDDEESHEVKRRDLNKYIFRLGVSVLDAGMFRFTKTDNVNSFAANITNWNIRNSNYSSIREFDTALANRVMPLANDPREYNVYLPGALSVQLDVRFVKGLYLNAMAYRPIKMGSEAGTRFNNYGYYSITPRYERRHFGIYIPYTFSDREDITNYRDNWLGLTLRLGPVFLGSSNLGSVAFNQKLKAADFFVGLKIGFTYGKPSNITRLFATKKDSSYVMLVTEKENREEMTRKKSQNQELSKAPANADSVAASRLSVDYTKGQVYSDGKPGQVIIMNNYYFYGNAPATLRDSLYNGSNITSGVAQQNAYRFNSEARLNLAQKTRTDSANKVLNDSLSQKREQLDSMINRLNHLRQRLDSTNREDNSSGYNNQQNNNNTALTPQQQILSADAYRAYRQQSERLQADIERLERQLVYNRSVAYNVTTQPNYSPPVYYNVSPPTTNYYPVNVPVSTQTGRDTIIIRDTVFVTKTNTITKEVQSASTSVIEAVPKEKIVEEKIDYKKLPPENILFATGQAVIGQVYQQKLTYLADILKENPELMIAITGHTDKTGPPAVNELLSLKRANAVKTFFVRKGINETRMQLAAVAAKDPLVAGESNYAKMQNRRVYIKIL